jgi:hypothetical protein
LKEQLVDDFCETPAPDATQKELKESKGKSGQRSGVLAFPDATQKELKEGLPGARCVLGLLQGCNSERIERQNKEVPLLMKIVDATQKELKARLLSHRVSTRVSERFSWVRLGCPSIWVL